jgi:hypothetical protein
MTRRIQLRRDIQANWEEINPILAQGELGIDLSNKNFKIGNGVGRWAELDYALLQGRLSRINSNTYIETGAQANDRDKIYFVNNGQTTTEISAEEYTIVIQALFTADIPSTNPYNGTIVVQGGMGVSGDLNIGGQINAEEIFGNRITIIDKIFGNVEGTVYGNLIGDVFNSTGSRILDTGGSGVPALYIGNINGNINSPGGSFFSNLTTNSGFIDGTIIGSNTPTTIKGTVITATDKFEGTLQGNLVGDVYAQNGTTKIIENSADGIEATFYGKLIGNIAGDFKGDIYANNSSRKVFENGAGNLPTDLDYAPAQFIGNVAGNITSNQISTFSNIEVNGGRLDNVIIGDNLPAKIVGTTIIATEVFIGQFEGIIVGSSTGDILASNGVKVLENGTDGKNAFFIGVVKAKDGTTTILDPGTGGPTDASTYLAAEYFGNVRGNLIGNVDATTVTTDSIDIDNININGNTISSTNGGIIISTHTSTDPLVINSKTLQATYDSTLGKSNFTLDGKVSVSGIIEANGGYLNTTSGIFKLLDDTATTINFAGAATNLEIGSATGTTKIKNDVTIDKNSNILGNLTVTQNLTVEGSLTYLKTTNTEIKANTIILNKGETGSGVTAGTAGIEIDRGLAHSSWIKWSEPTDTWEFGINDSYANTKMLDLSVTGNVSVVGDIDAANITTTANINVGGDFQVTGTSQFSGNITTNDISVDNLTVEGNETVEGTLAVTGLSTLATVDINGGNIDDTKIGYTTPSTIRATDVEVEQLVVKNQGEIRFKESTDAGNTYVGFKAPDSFVESYTLTLPAVKGIDGNVLAFNANGDKLEFVSADLFGGGQVAVSAENGDDANDGINRPVKTIKRALQIASGQVYDATGKVNGKRIVIAVASGEYYEDNPIIIPDNVSVVGAGLRACNIRPLNNGKDMLRVRNGCYFTEITFRDALNVDGKPVFTFNYAVAFDDATDIYTSRTGYINLPTIKPIITISPYVQNCSIISFLGGNGVLVDGNKVKVPNRPQNAIEAELVNNTLPGIPQQGKSMVANAFTMLSFGGTGWRVINDAYAQIVSCFQIFCLNGSYCQSGGYLSITNSATNFGQYALRASGYSPNAFDFNRGFITSISSFLGQDVITAIGFKELPNPHYVTRFREPSYKQAYDLINANKEELADDLISWINDQITNGTSPFFTQFIYNQAKCLRDAKIVLEAVAYDTLSGGNSKLIEAALSYSEANSITLNLQKEQNIAAFNRLRDITLPLVTSTGHAPIVAAKFNLLINVLDDPTTAPPIVEITNIGDITNNHIITNPNDIVPFNAANVDIINDTLLIPIHGLANMQKVVYSNNGNNDIPGLDNEQSYYVEVLNANTIRLFTDESKSKRADILSVGIGTHRLIKNVIEYFIDDLLTYHKVFQKLTLPSDSYTFIPGRLISATTQTGSLSVTNLAYVLSWDKTTKELIVAIDIAAQSPRFLLTSIITGDHSDDSTVIGGITPINVVNISDYYSATFKVGSTFGSAIIQNKSQLITKQIWLHRPSICNSSSHTWEYAGSGIDYNALPQNGGVTRVEYQQVSDLPGRVYTSGTNELGDFLVGDFIKAENKTGNVTFTNTVSIGELDALKLSINDIIIEEFSIDIQLGDSEPGGPKDSRISTQKAIRSFIQNKLSPFLDREVTTNNLAGAIPQLNSLGLLNADVIPPIRAFLIWKTNGYGSRLALKDTVPSSNVLPADISTENYSTIDVYLNSTITADDLTLIVQDNTNARGYLLGNVIEQNVITIASIDKTFEILFNNFDDLIIEGVGTYSLNTTPGIPTISPILVNQSSNYVLTEILPSQMLLLDTTQTYNFAGINPVTGAITKAQGYINSEDYEPTGLELGVIVQVDNVNKISGTGYIDNVYKNVPLQSLTGAGTGAKATLTVRDNKVDSVEMTSGGTGYILGEVLSATILLQNEGVGGFQIPVLKIENRLHINNVGGVKFSNTQDPDLKDFIQDANATTVSINQTGSIEISFDANEGVNTTPGVDTITIPNHGLIDGDPVLYDPIGQIEIGGNLQGPQADEVYYVKYIDSNTIQLYTNYTLLAQERVILYLSGQGTQKLIVSNIDLKRNTIFLAGHGYLKGTALKITGTALPVGFVSGQVYYVGSVTTNSFTLHDDKIDADNSFDGVVTEAKDIQNKPTGTMVLTRLNIRVDGAINTSSKEYANWSGLSANNIAANNIISGVISPSRLGSLAANNTTFLRGDSVYAPVVQNIYKPNDSAIILLGSFKTNANNIAEYTNAVSVDVDVVDGSESRASPGGFQWTNLGVARFNRDQFAVGSGTGLGQVTIKDLVVNAGQLDNNNAAYYLESSNHTIQPVNKGGTNISTYTAGDMLYASTDSILNLLPIADPFNVLQVKADGSKPEWSSTLLLSGLTVNGDITVSGAKSTLNAYDIKMDDNNIELGSVEPVFNREGVINYTGGGSLTTEVTIPLSNLGTTGLIPGMTITKVTVAGQPGLFGNDSKILSVDSATQFTVIGTTLPTSGTVRFNAGGASDDTANNGGLTIKSSVNKTLTWSKVTGAWTSSENMDLAATKTFMINNTTVLSENKVLGKELSSQAGKIMTSGSTWIRTFAFMGV